MEKKALLVIDVQNDFLPPTGLLAVADGRAILPLINEIMLKEVWDAIVVSQDWHPPNHCSFASQHNVPAGAEIGFTNPALKSDAEPRRLPVWPDHCVQNTYGARLETLLEDTLKHVTAPVCFTKKGLLVDREYYSCFKDVWGIDHTNVHEFLKQHAIKRVFVVGLAYDYCVLNSAIDCALLGYDTTVISDLCRSVSPENDDDTRKVYQENGVKVV